MCINSVKSDDIILSIVFLHHLTHCLSRLTTKQNTQQFTIGVKQHYLRTIYYTVCIMREWSECMIIQTALHKAAHCRHVKGRLQPRNHFAKDKLRWVRGSMHAAVDRVGLWRTGQYRYLQLAVLVAEMGK